MPLYFLNILGLASFLSGQKEKYPCGWLYRAQQIHLTWLDMGLMVCQQVYNPFYVMQTSSFNSHKWAHTPVGTLWHRGGVALWGGSSWVGKSCRQCSRKLWRVWLWNKEGDFKRQKNKTAMKTSKRNMRGFLNRGDVTWEEPRLSWGTQGTLKATSYAGCVCH